MAEAKYPKVAQLKGVEQFRVRLRELGLDVPCDEKVVAGNAGSPMAQEIEVQGFTIGNRWCAQPMEGWDGTTSGEPTELTIRRWEHFGASGCGLIWGGEAFAVQGDGRANPNQLGVVDGDYERAERGLRKLLAALGDGEKRLVGLQLTHSGRFCRPFDQKLRPMIAYHHPILDRKIGIAPDDDSCLISDDYLQRLIENFVKGAKLAQKVGFHFVDVKHCHGYLGHELLSGFTRKGKFGGAFENRTRFAREIVDGIKAECPGLMVGVRLSAFDVPAFGQEGRPEDYSKLVPYKYGFGCRGDEPMEMDLTEPAAFINMLGDRGVKLINVTAGSPYYNPHIQRPAIFPPSDGYQPPEDPLVGVGRQMGAVKKLKEMCPGVVMVGSGYSYLQEYLPNVAQAAVREGWVDLVGVGRLLLSYWDLAADTLGGKAMQSKRLCRTFSDCTTAPRNGLPSGCYPLDEFYKVSPQGVLLRNTKAAAKERQ